MTHYNTTTETGDSLNALNKRAKVQSYKVYEVFSDGKGRTSHEVFKELGCKYMNTSIRRAITNLKDAGKLIKTKERRKGFYGVNLIVWNKA